jgi:inner membrane transporter RhtA
MLDEHLSALQWMAIVCTMLAAAGSSVTARRQPPRGAPADVVM